MPAAYRLPSLSAHLGCHTGETPDFDEKFRNNFWFDPHLPGIDREGTLEEQIERSLRSLDDLLGAYRYLRSLEDDWGVMRQAA